LRLTESKPPFQAREGRQSFSHGDPRSRHSFGQSGRSLYRKEDPSAKGVQIEWVAWNEVRVSGPMAKADPG